MPADNGFYPLLLLAIDPTLLLLLLACYFWLLLMNAGIAAICIASIESILAASGVHI